MKVAFVGLGSMGGPQARLIARSGTDLAIFDPVAKAMDNFGDNARRATSAADAAQGVDVASVCVRDDQQVEEAVFGAQGLIHGLSSGALVMIHSTIKMDTLESLRQRLAGHGVSIIDAPVTRTRPTSDDPFVMTMMGGEDADVARARPVAELFSTDVAHIGPLGAGMALKIGNNMFTWASIVVGVQIAELTGRYNVPFEQLVGTLKANGNLTPTVEAVLQGQKRFKPGENPDYDELLQSQSGIGEKDLSLAEQSGAAVGLDMGLAAALRDYVRPSLTRNLG